MFIIPMSFGFDLSVLCSLFQMLFNSVPLFYVHYPECYSGPVYLFYAHYPRCYSTRFLFSMFIIPNVIRTRFLFSMFIIPNVIRIRFISSMLIIPNVIQFVSSFLCLLSRMLFGLGLSLLCSLIPDVSNGLHYLSTPPGEYP